MEPYVGEIRIFGGNFAPLGWLFCRGQLLQISEYDVLFQLIGTTYGGDGVTTFGVPNLASRVVVGQGQMPGGQNYQIGQMMGVESLMLNGTQLPVHAHAFAGTVNAINSGGTAQANPNGNYFGYGGGTSYNTGLGLSPDSLNTGAVAGQSSVVGSGQPHANIQPVLATSYIICTSGLYPSQQ